MVELSRLGIRGCVVSLAHTVQRLLGLQFASKVEARYWPEQSCVKGLCFKA